MMVNLQMILSEIKQSYQNAFQNELKEVFLYGSYARQDYDAESDIDVVAIVDGERTVVQEKLKSVWRDAGDIGLEYNVIVSPLAIPLSEFNMYKDVLPLYQNISREGVRIG